MIIGVSIADRHRPKGKEHVGIYMFEIPYDGNSHFEFLTLACPPESEAGLRPLLNRLLSGNEIPDPIKVTKKDFGL